LEKIKNPGMEKYTFHTKYLNKSFQTMQVDFAAIGKFIDWVYERAIALGFEQG
jgi:hypothetical protein